MIKKNLILLFITLAIFTPLLLGHGIRLTLEEKCPCVIVKAGYHAGNVLKNATVTIFYLSDTGSQEFQKGFTDKNGNFSFTPDKAGEWTVVVDDLTGHRGKKSLSLSVDFFNIPALSPPDKNQPGPVRVKETLPQKEEVKLPAENTPSPRNTSAKKDHPLLMIFVVIS